MTIMTMAAAALAAVMLAVQMKAVKSEYSTYLILSLIHI